MKRNIVTRQIYRSFFLLRTLPLPLCRTPTELSFLFGELYYYVNANVLRRKFVDWCNREPKLRRQMVYHARVVFQDISIVHYVSQTVFVRQNVCHKWLSSPVLFHRYFFLRATMASERPWVRARTRERLSSRPTLRQSVTFGCLSTAVRWESSIVA